MRDLKNKRALITGAASGIGKAIAFALADAGTHVYLVDIDAKNLAEVVEQCKARGVEAIGDVCDLRQPARISAAIQLLLSRWNGVDLLINNAGVSFYGRTHNMTVEQWDRVLAVNLLAPIQITRELLPTLRSRDEAHILNVCSILGLVTTHRLTAYQTTKFALVGFSKSLRSEYVRRGIGVTALCPGFVPTNLRGSTEFDAQTGEPPELPRLMLTTAERVAAVAVSAIRRNRAVVTVTPAARILWWLDRWIPSVLDFILRMPWRKRKRKSASQTLTTPSSERRPT